MRVERQRVAEEFDDFVSKVWSVDRQHEFLRITVGFGETHRTRIRGETRGHQGYVVFVGRVGVAEDGDSGKPLDSLIENSEWFAKYTSEMLVGMRMVDLSKISHFALRVSELFAALLFKISTIADLTFRSKIRQMVVSVQECLARWPCALCQLLKWVDVADIPVSECPLSLLYSAANDLATLGAPSDAIWPNPLRQYLCDYA